MLSRIHRCYILWPFHLCEWILQLSRCLTPSDVSRLMLEFQVVVQMDGGHSCLQDKCSYLQQYWLPPELFPPELRQSSSDEDQPELNDYQCLLKQKIIQVLRKVLVANIPKISIAFIYSVLSLKNYVSTSNIQTFIFKILVLDLNNIMYLKILQEFEMQICRTMHWRVSTGEEKTILATIKEQHQ